MGRGSFHNPVNLDSPPIHQPRIPALSGDPMPDAPEPQPEPQRAMRYGVLMGIVAIAAALAFLVVIVVVTQVASPEPEDAPDEVTEIDAAPTPPVQTP